MEQNSLKDSALAYHRYPTPGKISVQPTKPMATQRDLSLAYSPGVAEACMAIHADPKLAEELTSRGNLVAVVTNGTAVLGLGNIGPLAGKPVMEGKGCLFKKFAGIDVFDIEVAELDPEKFIETVARLEPTFGGINLEDIKAPECFYIEQELKKRMNIPVFHDDQHGTAIIAGAALLNALRHVDKKIGEIKLVCSGAGAAAISCLNLAVSLGVDKKNITVCDGKGVIYEGRPGGLDESKARYAQKTDARTLGDAVRDADVFLGLSAAGVLKPEMVKTMARDPLILAMANPDPEIKPEDALAARPDALIGTGRSDYPNQVNNVLCFPFIFRGALDCGATEINEAMKLATVHAIADLTHAEIPDVVAKAYGAEGLRFGRDYLIPKPFDPRLIVHIAPAVAQAAMDSGVATRPIQDMRAYRQSLGRFVYRSGNVMQPVFDAAQRDPKRVLYAEGDDERVLRAVQIVVDEGLAKPVLVGQRSAIEKRIANFGLRARVGTDIEVLEASGNDTTRAAAEALMRGDADAMLCGMKREFRPNLEVVQDVIGLRDGVGGAYAMNLLMLPDRNVFICDTFVNDEPSAEQIAEMAMLAAAEVRRFGVVPRVALVSHSNFGSVDSKSARRMRDALATLRGRNPDFEVEGEMHADVALSKSQLDEIRPGSALTDAANVLIMPSLDAANITFNALKATGGQGITVGPVLLGVPKAVNILSPNSTVRRIVNMTALSVVDASTPTAEAGGA